MVTEDSIELLEKLTEILTVGKYQILEDAEILQGVESLTLTYSNLSNNLDILVDFGAIELKFKKENEYCLGLSEKAETLLMRAKEELESRKLQEAQVKLAEKLVEVSTSPQSKKIRKQLAVVNDVQPEVVPKHSSVKTFFASFFGALLGSGLVVGLYHIFTVVI